MAEVRGYTGKKLQLVINEILVEQVQKYPSLWQMTAASYSDRQAKINSWKKVQEGVQSSLADRSCTITLTIEDLQKKWKNLRDSFSRELRNCKKVRSGDPGPPPRPKWPFFDSMLFIKDTVQPKETFSNFESADCNMSEDDVSEADPDDSFRVDTSQEVSPPSSSESQALKRRRLSKPQLASTKGKEKKKESVVEMIDLECEMKESMKGIKDLIAAKAKAAEGDLHMSFCLDVSQRLNKLDPHSVAYAKLRIQQVLYEIEYPDSHSHTPYSFDS